MGKNFEPYCLFCGATVGELSQRTGEEVVAIYDCEKCMMNYCSECSYESEIKGELEQICLRCDSILTKLSG